MESSRFGPFTPAAPARLPGLFAENLIIAPIVIDAPLATVWEVLVDFERYPEWNPLNRYMRLEGEPAPGSWLAFGYTLAGPGRDGRPRDAEAKRREVITVWEPECCLSYADIGIGYANERTQFVERIGADRTSYVQFERFSGVLSPLIRKIYGARIRHAFTHAGLALEARAENVRGGRVAK